MFDVPIHPAGGPQRGSNIRCMERVIVFYLSLYSRPGRSKYRHKGCDDSARQFYKEDQCGISYN